MGGHNFLICDSALTQIIENNTYLNDIIDEYDSMQINEAENTEKATEIIDKFLKREEEWDIKIVRFILDNFKNKKLIIDKNHFSKEVMNEINVRTAAFLGFDDIDYSVNYDLGWESIVPYSICNAVGVQYDEDMIRKYTQCDQCTYGKGLTREEYIREYAFLVNGKILK